MEMDPHYFDLSNQFGWKPRPIFGFEHWRGKFAMVWEYDIRKEHPKCKRAELICKRNGEYLFVVTQQHLDAICEAWQCMPFDIGDEVDGEVLMPDCSGF